MPTLGTALPQDLYSSSTQPDAVWRHLRQLRTAPCRADILSEILEAEQPPDAEQRQAGWVQCHTDTTGVSQTQLVWQQLQGLYTTSAENHTARWTWFSRAPLKDPYFSQASLLTLHLPP